MRKLYKALLLISLLSCTTVYANNTISYPVHYDTRSAGASSAYGLADVNNSVYFRALDFYNMKSNNKGLTIISNFKTYQQSTEITCGAAAILTVLYHYQQTGYDELQIANLIDTKNERDVNGEIGAATKPMVAFFKQLGWQVDSSLDKADSNGVSFADIGEFAKFVQTNLSAGKPVLVENMYWGGHWRVIIGYDTMGTADMTDDVLIFADPYDTQDHKQDGYTVQTLAGFYYTWQDVDMLPKDQRVQQWIVAKPK